MTKETKELVSDFAKLVGAWIGIQTAWFIVIVTLGLVQNATEAQLFALVVGPYFVAWSILMWDTYRKR